MQIVMEEKAEETSLKTVGGDCLLGYYNSDLMVSYALIGRLRDKLEFDENE